MTAVTANAIPDAGSPCQCKSRYFDQHGVCTGCGHAVVFGACIACEAEIERAADGGGPLCACCQSHYALRAAAVAQAWRLAREAP